MASSCLVLFHRELLDFSGGHLKVHDYFSHVESDPALDARIYFTPSSIWTERNPWHQLKLQESPQLVQEFRPQDADVLVLAGMDWLALSESERREPPCPIINLIQHVRHAEVDDPRNQFLVHPATRICVSQEVADALDATGKVNGPILTIPNGLDFRAIPPVLRPEARQHDVMIIGIKQVKMGQKLTKKIRKAGFTVDLLDRNVPRDEFLSRLADARTGIFLPDPTEGFYLPPLESMVLRTLVICPNCEGNRVFCHPDKNSLQPGFSVKELLSAFLMAQSWTPSKRQALIDAASETASHHDIAYERKAFLKVLKKLK